MGAWIKRKQRDYTIAFNLAEAKQMVDESVQIYNQKCRHLSLKYKTPDAVHQAFFATKTVNVF